MHNGVKPLPDAVGALVRARRRGGIVVLISNAPRPSWAVRNQIHDIGVDASCYDGLVTSGDIARTVLGRRPGARVFHLGPDRDHSIYDSLEVDLCDLDSADIVCCTGLVDDKNETPGDYDPTLRRMVERRLSMICANPDLAVESGGRLLPCAGALAVRYKELGGEAMIVGKPFPPIYKMALDEIAAVAGSRIRTDEILAVGDGAGTDIDGANRAGIQALFIASGVHATNIDETDSDRDSVFVERVLRSHSVKAIGYMDQLAW